MKGLETSSFLVCSPSGELGRLCRYFTLVCPLQPVQHANTEVFPAVTCLDGNKQQPKIRLCSPATADSASDKVQSPEYSSP